MYPPKQLKNESDVCKAYLRIQGLQDSSWNRIWTELIRSEVTENPYNQWKNDGWTHLYNNERYGIKTMTNQPKKWEWYATEENQHLIHETNLLSDISIYKHVFR